MKIYDLSDYIVFYIFEEGTVAPGLAIISLMTIAFEPEGSKIIPLYASLLTVYFL